MNSTYVEKTEYEVNFQISTFKNSYSEMRISFQRKKEEKGEERLAEAVFTQAK